MADFDVKTGYNAAFKTFVDFAQKTHKDGYDSANAKATLVGRQLTVSPLSLHETSNLLRKSSEGASNDATRELFRKAVADMFGGEGKIPSGVKDAMLLNDYGHGRPLTARRIMAVKAEVDNFLKQHADFNNGIFTQFYGGNIGGLPDDMQGALGDLVDYLRGIFGDALVPQGALITKVLPQNVLTKEVEALRDAANVQGRDITKDQIVSAFASKAFAHLANIAAGNVVSARIKARLAEPDATARGMGSSFYEAYPTVRNEILNCKSPAEIEAVLQRHEAEIESFVDVFVRTKDIAATVVPKATAKLAEQLGLDSRIVAAHIPLDVLKEKVGLLNTAVLTGKAPGCREEGYDMQAAYDDLADRFIRQRVDAWRAIDALQDVPVELKDNLKTNYLAFRKIPAISPAQLLEAARQIDTGKLVNALSPNLPTSVAATLLDRVFTDFAETVKAITGNANVFDGMGMDEIMAIADMAVNVVNHENPQLAPAVQNVQQELRIDIDTYCIRKGLNMGQAFVETLVRNGGENPPEVIPKYKYLSIVEDEAEAALDEFLIKGANPELRDQFKNAMREAASQVFDQAMGLTALSDHLATIKAEAGNAVRQSVPAAPPAPAQVPELTRKLVSGTPKIPKITNQQELLAFFETLKLDTKCGSVWEDDKAPDALGKERQTYVYKGIVFRSDGRRMDGKKEADFSVYDGFTSKNDLTVQRNRTEAMGLGVKGTDEKGEDELLGPGATGTSGVSCAKTIDGAIGYLQNTWTFYIIDTTKLPPEEKAWDMEQTVLKNKLKDRDESNGEVNISFIPKKAVIGWVYMPGQSKVAEKADNEARMNYVKSAARGNIWTNLHIQFNPEYEA